MKKLKGKVRDATQRWHRREASGWTEFLVHAYIRRHHKMVLNVVEGNLYFLDNADKEFLREELQTALTDALMLSIPKQ